MKIRYLFLLLVLLNSCVGTGTSGLFGTGVSVAVDPRSIGTQIDDTIMQKSLSTRLTLEDKKYFLSVKTKVLDGRIFITGKVDNPEEKLKITNKRKYLIFIFFFQDNNYKLYVLEYFYL